MDKKDEDCRVVAAVVVGLQDNDGHPPTTLFRLLVRLVGFDDDLARVGEP